MKLGDLDPTGIFQVLSPSNSLWALVIIAHTNVESLEHKLIYSTDVSAHEAFNKAVISGAFPEPAFTLELRRYDIAEVVTRVKP